MKQEKWITGILCLLFIVAAGFFYLHAGQKDSLKEATLTTGNPTAVSADPSDGSRQKTAQPNETTEYAVYICGAVKHPGVYRFREGARVCDVIEAAGGFRQNAAQAAVNQAQLITDGEQIEIPTAKQWKQAKKHKTAENSASDASDSASGGSDSTSDSGLVNLNTATEAELMTLSGIGQSKAKAVLDYREQNGSFSSVEDVMKVSGIKEGVYNQIKDSITV